VEDLSKIAATLPEAELGSVERVSFGQRRANAAVTLLRLGASEKVLPVFVMTDDPEALSQFIFRCRPRGVGIDALLDLLELVSSERQGASRRFDAQKYAILLAIGEFTLMEIPSSRREPLLKQLSDTYRTDPSSGVHSAAGWLLRNWGQAEVVREVDQTPVPYSLDREWFTLAITVTPKSPPKPKEEPGKEKGESELEPATLEPPVEPLPPKTFYYTFIVFPSGSSEIGSVADEPDRHKSESRWIGQQSVLLESLDKETYPREPNPVAKLVHGIGHWNWVAEVFGYRQNRSGSLRVEREREHPMVTAVTRACLVNLVGSKKTVANTFIRRVNFARVSEAFSTCMVICLSGRTTGFRTSKRSH